MALPVCIEIPEVPDNLEVIMPGGATLQNIKDRLADADLPDVPAGNILAQAGPALATIKPIFDIIDTIKAILDCQKAVPEAVGSLSPSPILECLPVLSKKVDALLKLLPQVSGALMVVGILDSVIAFLNGGLVTLDGLVEQANKLIERIERAAELGDQSLDELLICAQNDINKSAEGVTNALIPIGQLLDVVNVVLELIGQDPIELEVTEPESLTELIQLLSDLIDTLQGVRDLIPL